MVILSLKIFGFILIVGSGIVGIFGLLIFNVFWMWFLDFMFLSLRDVVVFFRM